jgi:hypothetical protein
MCAKPQHSDQKIFNINMYLSLAMILLIDTANHLDEFDSMLLNTFTSASYSSLECFSMMASSWKETPQHVALDPISSQGHHREGASRCGTNMGVKDLVYIYSLLPILNGLPDEKVWSRNCSTFLECQAA